MAEDLLQKEKAKLKEILLSYKEVIEFTELSIKSIPKMYKDNPELLNSLLSQAETKLVNLYKGLDKPYFARIDFTDNQKTNKNICYIGKVGVLDPDNNIVTVDWRAPIATLYYDSNVGAASYECPDGIIDGTLDLKRQFEISKGELTSFQDIDTVSNDELLKPYLGVNADSRLKNIVASIQGEQNAIIREKLNKNIIVQGVAGSGKTTVALHRIAYLVYNNRNNIKPEQYMVIGPNKFFINYISSVLPDLDVTNVPQLTYEELAHEFIDEPFDITSSSNTLTLSITQPKSLEVAKYKSSMNYKRAIDKYLKYFETTLIPKNDFAIKGLTILSSDLIRQTYNQMTGYATDDLQAKVNRCILLLGKRIEDNFDHFISKANQYSYDRFMKNKDDKEELAKIQKDIQAIKKELENNCRQSLRRYFSKLDTKILNIYGDFISQIEKYTTDDLTELKAYTQKLTKKKKVDFEDLAAIIYIKERVKGSGEYKDYRHIVIDEAQDFGDFNFYALHKIMTNGTFSIFGDLAQSIYSYRGIDDWNSVIENTFNNHCEVLQLLKSYRTTVEIMNAANNITDHIGLSRAQPVIRHGLAVNVDQIDPNNMPTYIYNKISEFSSKGYSSIAIISKTDADSGKLNLELKKLGMDINHISSSDEPYVGGICTMPSYLSKGLEFDAVIIDDVSEHNFSSDKKIDMQLLYVSMTRPLHELNLSYNNEITLPLKNLLNEKESESITK